MGQSATGKLIQQFVQADEGGAADIPVDLLDAAEQVEQIRHGRVQKGDGLPTGGGIEGVAGFIHENLMSLNRAKGCFDGIWLEWREFGDEGGLSGAMGLHFARPGFANGRGWVTVGGKGAMVGRRER